MYNCTIDNEVAGLEYVIDTSIIIAVLVNEENKSKLVGLTRGAGLNAPASLHWEVGNAFSAMFKRGRMDTGQAVEALTSYGQIPVRLHDVDLAASLDLAESLGIYAYDAYYIECARKLNSPLLTLDATLLNAARRSGVDVIAV